MACLDPIRQCLYEHIRPHLASADVENDGNRIRARCPACGTSRTLTISAGQHGRATYNCFNHHCDPAELRAALIKAGVPSGCIPLSKSTDTTIAQTIAAAIQQGTRANRARTLLRVYLIAQGHVRWPKGTELEKLAAECGVSKAEAYGAKKSGPLLHSNLVPPVPRGSRRAL